MWIIAVAYWLTTVIVNWLMIWWQGENAPIDREHWQSYLLFVLLSPFTISETINAALINWNKTEQLKSGISINLLEMLEDTEFADIDSNTIFIMIGTYAEEGNGENEPFDEIYDLCRYYKENGRLTHDESGWHFDENTNSED